MREGAPQLAQFCSFTRLFSTFSEPPMGLALCWELGRALSKTDRTLTSRGGRGNRGMVMSASQKCPEGKKQGAGHRDKGSWEHSNYRTLRKGSW